MGDAMTSQSFAPQGSAPEFGPVLRAVDALEQVQAQMAAIGTRSDDQRRHDLIQLRRELAARIADIGSVAHPLFERLGDEALLLDFRNRFSQMRSTTALHQADWPAVSLGERPSEYLTSALRVQDMNRAFVAWIRDALVRLQG